MKSRKPIWLRGSSLLLESGLEKAADIAFDFADSDYARRLYRWTGGCGFMNENDWRGLEILYEGFILAGEVAYGHHLFGGTRMRGYNRPEIVIPGITEVPPRLRKHIGDHARFYGVTPKVATPTINDDWGTIISEHEDAAHPYGGYFTTFRGDSDVTLFYQPSVNHDAKYDDERLRSKELTKHLVSRGWPVMLISYNGGGVTEREIRSWCEECERDPAWAENARILLVKDSGRITHQLATDRTFLADNPWVRVVELEAEHIAAVVRECMNPKA